MSALVNKFDALSVKLRKPRTAAWHADVDISGEVTLTNPVTIDVDGYKFTGHAVTQHPFAGRTQAWIVGGAGGLSKKIAAQHYTNATPSVVIRDILTACGESLDVSSIIPNTRLGHWEREESAASHALVAIVDHIGLVWRTLDNGKVWVGADKWVALKASVEVLDEDWETSCLTLAADEFASLATIQPGVSLNGHQIKQVTHLITRSETRTIASTESLEEAASSFLSAIRSATASSNTYECEVVAQNSDGTLQLKPHDSRIAGRGLNNVPIRYGMPGWEAKVTSGAVVRVAFDGGNWDRPYACLWDSGNNGSVVSMSFLGGYRGFARVGDLVQVAAPPAMPLTGTLSGAPFVGVLAIATPFYGIIQSGHGQITG